MGELFARSKAFTPEDGRLIGNVFKLGDELWYIEDYGRTFGPYSTRKAAETALTRYTAHLSKVDLLSGGSDAADDSAKVGPPPLCIGACCSHGYECRRCKPGENLEQYKLTLKEAALLAAVVVSSALLLLTVVGAVAHYTIKTAQSWGWIQ
jgi:hypothetical protein